MTTPDFLEIASRASRPVLALAGTITASDLALPTPCKAWNLGELLAHMTGQNRGFSSAAKGWGSDRAAWAPIPVSPAAPSAGYEGSVDAVHYALVVAVAMDQGMRVPEIDPHRDFPASSAVGFYLVDTLAHGWDLARTLDRRFDVQDDILAVATQIAARIPDDDARQGSSALFAPRVPPSGGDPLGSFLRLLGRDPSWSAPVAVATADAVHA